MARLRLLTKEDLPEQDRELLKRGINLHRILAHSPNATRAFGKLGTYTRFDSKLDPRLRELAILQVGYSTRSKYEYSHHIKVGREFGVSDADIRAVAAETRGEPTNLEPVARTVLRAAREIVADHAPSDATFAELEATFDEERLVDLIIAISFYCCVIRVLESFRIDVEPEYLHYLEEFPLPR